MKVQTRDTENGTEIHVRTDKKIAVSVQSGDSERIYLPEVDSDSSTYYADSTEGLIPTSEGYKVVHTGRIDSFEVIH